jgi:hypothetical protein
MSPEKTFDLLAQELIGAARLVQVRCALLGIFLIQGCFKYGSLAHGFPTRLTIGKHPPELHADFHGRIRQRFGECADRTIGA